MLGGLAYATAKLLDRLPGVILALGDLAYESGSSDEYRDCYEPTWGRHKARTWPALGNHEYLTPGAQGYFTYWGERAGPSRGGFYGFHLGAWHLVALNSNADATDGSAQDRWLRRDLAATKARCVLAFWHHPLFSSGPHGNNPKMELLYRRLYESGATLVLAGHDHLYERFAPPKIRRLVWTVTGASASLPPEPAARSVMTSRPLSRTASSATLKTGEFYG